MKLSESQIKEILSSPKLQTEIQEGKKYESRLRIFTEPKTENQIKKEVGWDEINNFLDKIFNAERSKRIKDFINFPLSSVDITESILTDLYKVFDARNTFFDFELPKNKGGEKLKKAIDEINPIKWIEKNGKEALKNKPNTIVVIDKDKDGKPYLIAVNNDRVIDCCINSDATLNYIAFVHSIEKTAEKQIKRVSFYDDEYYRVFIEKESGYELEDEVKHKAGICPARMFINETINSKDDFNRKIPFTSTFSKIKEWQLFDILEVII